MRVVKMSPKYTVCGQWLCVSGAFVWCKVQGSVTKITSRTVCFSRCHRSRRKRYKETFFPWGFFTRPFLVSRSKRTTQTSLISYTNLRKKGKLALFINFYFHVIELVTFIMPCLFILGNNLNCNQC